MQLITEDLDQARPAAGFGVSRSAATSLAVLVVGMHRSGTSALSGVLDKLGVGAPEVLHPSDEHNPRGYFEPERIIDFHERLLARLGSPSNDPLPLDYGWLDSPVGAAAAEELAALIDGEFAGRPVCLFKDPRICRLLPVWSTALARSGRGAAAVLPYRHPLEVAQSLASKAGVGRSHALFMWLQHILYGERFTRGMPRSFTAYDDLLTDWRAVTSKAARQLGVSWPRDLMRAAPEIDAFLTRELRHHEARSGVLDPNDPLEALCLRAWRGLDRFDADPRDAGAMAAFDAILGEFDAALGVCGPLVVDYQRTMSALLADRELLVADRQAVMAARDALGRRLRFEEQAHLTARRSHELAVERRFELERRVEERERWIADVIQEQARHHEAVMARMAQLDDELVRLRQIEASLLWVASKPLRRALAKAPALRRLGRGTLAVAWRLAKALRPRSAPATGNLGEAAVLAPQDGPAGPQAPGLEAAAETALPVRGQATLRRGGEALRILFISGESSTPGHYYRVMRLARAAERAGASAEVVTLEELADGAPVAPDADIVFIWRACWTEPLGAFIAAAKAAGAQVVFDIDDLAFDPALAGTGMIDGIRSQGLSNAEVADHFSRMRAVLAQADVCTAPTQALADQTRRLGKPAAVLPNTFDDAVVQRSRLAVRRRRAAPSDGLIRIGYATGSRTHQADFAVCAQALAEVLRAHPEARLVLFGDSERPVENQVLMIDEFPAFAGVEGQIEWRSMVLLEALPDELARFDINIAPLEVGNLFCEAKSELKFFEAALVGVPTIASPTDPYRRAIRDGETGLLAVDAAGWREALTRLVEDAGLRSRMAEAAFRQALMSFGPERCAEAVLSLLEQLAGAPGRGARAFELDLIRAERPAAPAPSTPGHEIVFHHDALSASPATVVVPLFNYAGMVEEALDSVRAQTMLDLDLIVVDDASTDDSLAVAQRWLETHAGRFNRALLIRNTRNSGLGFTRNVGFANAETPYVLPLDADNRLRPDCVERLLAELEQTSAAFAYPTLQEFGDSTAEANLHPWLALRLTGGNYIDAMALVRRSAWFAAGGYDHVRYGWEDYDLWCRLAERGLYGVRVPEILAEYRVHGGSMLRTETDLHDNKLALIADMERRHPWLRPCRPAPPAGPGA